jgi:uracil-DNA glycosylase family 4
MKPAGELAALRKAVVGCTLCPELRSYCARVARAGKPEFAGERYWGKPIPSLGDSSARLLVVGLAPAAHGGNRTGRMFTGDGSAVWLSRALYKAGFATQPSSLRRGDGFALVDAFITAALRCAPPANKPTPRQLARCARHMRQEIELLRRLSVVVGLGKIGFDAAVDRLREAGYAFGRTRPPFGHGVEYRIDGPPARSAITLLGCFHPSRQNTNTGKLTEPMLDSVFARARKILEG